MEGPILCFMFLLFPSYSETITTEYLSEACNVTGRSLDGTRRLEPTPYLWYNGGTSCFYHVAAATGKHVLLTIKMFHLEPQVAGSCVDYINIYDGNGITGTTLNPSPLCGRLPVLPNTTYLSTGNDMTIHLLSDGRGEGRGFEFIIVPVSTGACSSSELACTNTSVCIEEELRCNSVDECGDGTDENDCVYEQPSPVRLSPDYPLIIGLVLGIPGGLLVCVIVSSFMWHHHKWRLYVKKPFTADPVMTPTSYEMAYPITKLYYKDKYHSIYENPAFKKADLIRKEEERARREDESRRQDECETKGTEEVKKDIAQEL